MVRNVVAFRDPNAPLEGEDLLAARKAFRSGCKEIAARTVARALSESAKLEGIGNLDIDHALPMFVAAMRRELRKSGLFR